MIELGNVSFRYPGAVANALDNVSLTIEPGITMLTGPLGAGTSTVLLVASGLVPTEVGGELEGVVRILGHDPTKGRGDLTGQVGLLLDTPWAQLSGIRLTVWDEVAFGPSNLGWSRDRIDHTVERALRRCRIEHLAKRSPDQLSGGEVQRVVLAATLASEPEVLLLDDPTSEMDGSSADALFDLLPALAQSTIVVLATTDLDRATPVIQHAVLMDEGRVVATGGSELLGSADAVQRECATSAATIAARAALPAPFPVSLPALVERVRAT